MKKSRDYLLIEECAAIAGDVKARIDPVMAAAKERHGDRLLGFIVAVVVELEPGMSYSRLMVAAPRHIARQALQKMLQDIEGEEGWSRED